MTKIPARTSSAVEPPLILIGGGGHSLVVAEAAMLLGHALIGFYDDNEGAVLGSGTPSAPRLGSLRDVEAIRARLRAERDAGWIVVIGDAGVRRRAIDAMEEFNARAVTVVHPGAMVSASAVIGRGVYVGPRAVVHTRARVRDHAIINTGCIVEHECEIGENVHCAPGSVLGGRTAVGQDSLVGIGARSLPGAKIGAGAVVGAGAMVLKEVAAGCVVMGVPAREGKPR